MISTQPVNAPPDCNVQPNSGAEKLLELANDLSVYADNLVGVVAGRLQPLVLGSRGECDVPVALEQPMAPLLYRIRERLTKTRSALGAIEALVLSLDA